VCASTAQSGINITSSPTGKGFNLIITQKNTHTSSLFAFLSTRILIHMSEGFQSSSHRCLDLKGIFLSCVFLSRINWERPIVCDKISPPQVPFRSHIT